MSFVVPVVLMILFGGLFVATYAWMRRADFGERDADSSSHDERTGTKAYGSSPLIESSGHSVDAGASTRGRFGLTVRSPRRS